MRLDDFALERYFARWEFNVTHLLCASDMEPVKMAHLLAFADDECRALWEKLSLGYTEAPGHPLLRREIAGLYETVGPEGVLTFAGAEEAIFVLANALLSPGDHAVCFWPAYQSLVEVARGCGAEVTRVPLREEDGWAPDVDALRAAVRPNTRIVIANFPHNPTGAHCPPEAFAAILDIAREAGAYLLSDEVYRFLEHDPAALLPAAADRYEKAISVGVMSKAFGLAGLRVGWMATRDGDALRAAAAFKDYTSICNAAPSEILALIALRSREVLMQRSRGLLRRNFARVEEFLAKNAEHVAWTRPAAGCTAFPRLTIPGVSVEALALEAAKRDGVLLLPGSVYGAEFAGHFRFGFGRADLYLALDEFGKCLRRVSRRVARAGSARPAAE